MNSENYEKYSDIFPVNTLLQSLIPGYNYNPNSVFSKRPFVPSEVEKHIERNIPEWNKDAGIENLYMHEYLEFKTKPKHPELIEYIQYYLFTLLYLYINHSKKKTRKYYNHSPLVLDAKLIIDGVQFSSDNIVDFIRAIENKLPTADGFILDIDTCGEIRCYSKWYLKKGFSIAKLFKEKLCLTYWGMYSVLNQYKAFDSFTYKQSVLDSESFDSYYNKIENGKEIPIMECGCNSIYSPSEDCLPSVLGTTDFIKEYPDSSWFANSVYLGADFDIEKHHDVQEKILEIVRESIPADELRFLDDWDTDWPAPNIMNGIQWDCGNLTVVQNCLDRINELLLSLGDDLKDTIAAGSWDDAKNFAVASVEWTDEGFKLFGQCY